MGWHKAIMVLIGEAKSAHIGREEAGGLLVRVLGYEG